MQVINYYERNFENLKIAVIGLGYVGLPLAFEFGKKYNVVGFDSNKRVDEIKNGYDSTLEITGNQLEDLKQLNIFLIQDV